MALARLVQPVHQDLRATPALPLPGGGDTLGRWRQLAAWAARDMALAKLLEAHHDALAILDDLDRVGTAPADSVWAVWAAGDPRLHLHARRVEAGWVLAGAKPWCSGFDLASHALLTCESADGPALMAVALRDPSIQYDDSHWAGLGMRDVATATAIFHDTPCTRVAAAADYLHRPGFWHGGAGIAACWWGATAAVADTLRRALRPDRPHAAAQLGQVEAVVASAAAFLRALAVQIDTNPRQPHLAAVLTARLLTKRAALDTIQRVNDALGPGPLCSDHAHAQRCADLQVWVRQHHSGNDEAALGALVSERGEGWLL